MKISSFQDFIEEYWWEHEAEGQTKDAGIEACERWQEGLDVQEVIDLGELYGKQVLETCAAKWQEKAETV